MPQERTCAKCNDDCHDKNIKNFVASTQWREKALAYSSTLMDFREMLIRWSKQSMDIYKDTEKSEYREIAQNYLAEVDKINAVLDSFSSQQEM